VVDTINSLSSFFFLKKKKFKKKKMGGNPGNSGESGLGLLEILAEKLKTQSDKTQ